MDLHLIVKFWSFPILNTNSCHLHSVGAVICFIFDILIAEMLQTVVIYEFACLDSIIIWEVFPWKGNNYRSGRRRWDLHYASSFSITCTHITTSAELA